MYDCGYKDGANDGYKLAIEDQITRLNKLGLKPNVEFKNTKEFVDTVITWVEFYKLAYEEALSEIAESHSSEEVEVDGTMCFCVTCGCEFCTQFMKINEEAEYDI